MIGLATAWAVLLAVLAFTATGQPTVREQQSAAAAQPAVDRAIAASVVAAGTDLAVVVGGYERTRACEVTGNRDGVDYQRVADVYTHPGQEQVVLDRLASGLARDFRTVRHPSSGTDPEQVTGNAGSFVELLVEPVGRHTGQVRVVALTGCRPIGDPATSYLVPVTPAELEALRPVLAAVPSDPPRWRVRQVPCPGGVIRTVEATVPDPGPGRSGPLADRLRVALPAGAALLASTEDRLVYRQGSSSVVVRPAGGRLVLQSTMDCAG